jgi:ABC-2 type transport system permease protein/ribosome-dependent ATPase
VKRLLSITRKEIKEIVRTRLFLILAFFVPFTMFIVFSYGISLDVEHMPFACIDYDRSSLSAEMLDAFTGRYFKLKDYLTDTIEAEELLSKGEIRAVLVIPPDFSKRLMRGETAYIQFLIDGGYPYIAITVKGYAEAITSAFNMKLLRSETGVEVIEPIRLQIRYLFNESLKSSYALIPGLIAIVLLMNPAVLAALAITREKEFGTIYNIYSSPIKRWEFLTGKIIPYLVISLINFVVIITSIKLIFHIPMKGNLINLIPGTFIYILINVSIGLLVSSVTRTMVSAQIVALIITVIPAFLYSGLLIPVSNLGSEAKVMAHIYPTMHFMQIIHGVYLKKLGLVQLMPQVLFLALYFIILFSIAIIVFRKREG